MSYACAEEPAEPDSTAQSVSTQADGSGEAVQTHQLAGITVEGDKDVLPGGMVNTKAKLGILGDKSIMDIPYSEMSMTAKQLETFDDPSHLYKMCCLIILLLGWLAVRRCTLILVCVALI